MNRPRAAVGLAALAAAVVTLAVHGPAVENGLLSWDDRLYIEKAWQHREVSAANIGWAFTTIEDGNYLPLTWLSHMADCRLWESNARGHHATSVVLHAVSAALVVWLVWMLTGIADLQSRPATLNEKLAMAVGVGLVFGIHPLQVESVAWVAQRKNVLCGLFCVASLCAYVRAVSGGPRSVEAASAVGRDPAAAGRPSMAWWWAMTLLFAAALLSKAMAVVLPVVMLVLDFFPLRRHVSVGWPRLLREKALLIAMSALVVAVTLLAQLKSGAGSPLADFGLLSRALVAARGVVFYLWKLMWPAWLSPFYPLEGAVSIGQKEFLVPVTAVLAVTVLAVWQRRRAPAVTAAWVAYLAFVMPVSGLLQFGSQAAADRYMYVALLPPLMLVAGGGVWLWRRCGGRGRMALVALLGCVCAFMMVRTREQIAVWRDDETLWRAAWQAFPNSEFANYQLSRALAHRQRFSEARLHAETAVALRPDRAENHGTLGLILLQLHEDARGHAHVAEAQALLQQLPQALAHAQEAVQRNPDDAFTHATLGHVYLKMGQPDRAAMELEEALRRDAKLAVARYHLACAYAALGKLQESFDALRQVVAVEPRLAGLAAREPELAVLRNDRILGARLRELMTAAGAP